MPGLLQMSSTAKEINQCTIMFHIGIPHSVKYP
uniref:Uncharacterized protein n=1 Tax=Arundo donax TaxID=35708 RepID=A0A0A9FU86_ARUDO